MKRDINTKVTLNNGVQIPQLGFGTALIKDADEGATREAVLQAIEAGYRHIDTAMIYYSERAVGQAVRESKIPREEFFITTKLWNEDIRKGRQKEAFEESLEALQMDYVDMYMIHWPIRDKYINSWEVLQDIYAEGRAKAIGVSNYSISHLEDLRETCDIVPAVNQCEFHPRFMQNKLREYCKKNNIHFEAYKPLGQGAYVDNEILKDIAEKNGKSFAQILIRWHLQHGIIAIPKASHEKYIKANADVFDFELDTDEMDRIDAMNVERSTSNCTPSCFDF